MARRNEPMKVYLNMKLPDGKVVPWFELEEKEKQACLERMEKNLSANLTAYFEAHPEEYEPFRRRYEEYESELMNKSLLSSRQSDVYSAVIVK